MNISCIKSNEAITIDSYQDVSELEAIIQSRLGEHHLIKSLKFYQNQYL